MPHLTKKINKFAVFETNISCINWKDMSHSNALLLGQKATCKSEFKL